MEEFVMELLRAVLTPERVLVLGELSLAVLLTVAASAAAVHYLTEGLKARLGTGGWRSLVLTLLPVALGGLVGGLGWLLVGWSLLWLVGLVTGLMHTLVYKILTSLIEAAAARAVAQLRAR